MTILLIFYQIKQKTLFLNSTKHYVHAKDCAFCGVRVVLNVRSQFIVVVAAAVSYA